MMKARNLINLRSEILEPLHRVADELSEVDKRQKAHLLEYTELDVIAAAVVFSHILANKKAHSYVKVSGTKDLESISKEMEDYGQRIRKIVLDMANIDLKEEKK